MPRKCEPWILIYYLLSLLDKLFACFLQIKVLAVLRLILYWYLNKICSYFIKLPHLTQKNSAFLSKKNKKDVKRKQMSKNCKKKYFDHLSDVHAPKSWLKYTKTYPCSYFINHYTKSTSWEDPRVRYQQIGKPTSSSAKENKFSSTTITTVTSAATSTTTTEVHLVPTQSTTQEQHVPLQVSKWLFQHLKNFKGLSN